ncbi:hypothetical protein BU23DRAFT_558169 [Bimuria novae-zelandiae CBS 107.79]|uniref:Uncharacterized protein n=1 Tax=Bimuria novae-zelandiae CBS 107.79 TaxID=1447943 RepID=A0A6A5UVQ6_9PLEO|nr:hypothetical protein BU23DRAFT_558169 [Bimuria novae-zelandiae CBS 107.79]
MSRNYQIFNKIPSNLLKPLGCLIEVDNGKIGCHWKPADFLDTQLDNVPDYFKKIFEDKDARGFAFGVIDGGDDVFLVTGYDHSTKDIHVRRIEFKFFGCKPFTAPKKLQPQFSTYEMCREKSEQLREATVKYFNEIDEPGWICEGFRSQPLFILAPLLQELILEYYRQIHPALHTVSPYLIGPDFDAR